MIAGNKKARDCGDSAGRAASGRKTGDGYNMQNQRHAVKAEILAQKIKCEGYVELITAPP